MTPTFDIRSIGDWLMWASGIAVAGVALWKLFPKIIKGVKDGILFLPRERHHVLKSVAVLPSIQKTLAEVLKELKPNGGTSLRDCVNRVEVMLQSNTMMTEEALSACGLIAWTTDAAGHYNWVSDAWSNLTGVSRERAKGNGWAVAIAEVDRAEVWRQWIESCKEERPFSMTFLFHTSGGSVKVEASASAMKDNMGRVIGYLGKAKLLGQAQS